MRRLPLLLVLMLAATGGSPRAQARVILATTTSTADTGLLDRLLPIFEAGARVTVKIIAVGSGEALAMGRRGDADVLLVHSPGAEVAFMAGGWGSLRLDVMHNDFLLAGPASDPANVKGQPILDALRRIQASDVGFVSRGDESGTHKKEQELWSAAGVVPSRKALISTGQGMSESARVASEKHAYILIDRGSFLALRRSLNLVALSDGGKELLNPYRVIVVNPAKNPKVKATEGEAFARWLVSPEAQTLICEFGRKEYGQPLYFPDAPERRP